MSMNRFGKTCNINESKSRSDWSMVVNGGTSFAIFQCLADFKLPHGSMSAGSSFWG